MADTLTQILQPPLQVQTACLTTAITTDLTADLHKVTQPVLVVHGDADASAPLPITGQPTAELLADADLLVYPGAPHGLYVTEKDRLNADVLTFLDNTRNASSTDKQPAGMTTTGRSGRSDPMNELTDRVALVTEATSGIAQPSPSTSSRTARA